MTDDRITSARRIPPPPPRRAPSPDRDAELDGAYADLSAADSEPRPQERREDFAVARRRLVDAYVVASGGRLHHSQFNKLPIDRFDEVAAEHGVKGFGELGEIIAENQALRTAFGSEVVGRHRHVQLDDLADILHADERFDPERVRAAAAQVEEERRASARGLLTSALAEAGIDTTAEDFDLDAVLQRAAQPPKTTDAEIPPGWVVSTPESRTANLPSGRPPTLPTGDRGFEGLTGSALIEAQAREDLAKGKFR